MTLRPIQTWYDKMSSRERFMLVAFAWVAILLWFSLLLSQLKAMRADVNKVNETLKNQAVYLTQKQVVENKLQAQRTEFQHTYNQNALFAKVQQYIKDSELGNASISGQPNQTKEIFNVNSVTVHYQKVPFRNLVGFAAKILGESPYLAIDEIMMTPETLNPTIISGDMRINSLELKPGALDATATTAAKTTAVAVKH